MTITSSKELIERYQNLGGSRLRRAANQIALQLEQDGVTFNPATDRVLPTPVTTGFDDLPAESQTPAAPISASGTAAVGSDRAALDDGPTGANSRRGLRPWALDVAPLTFDPDEWRDVERGLEQRAVLLDAILQDLHGPRQLIRDGLIPLSMVMADPAFARPVHGIGVTGSKRLTIAAVDLYKDTNGQWRSYGHRTQMSAGVVYALENRRILARTFPELFREAGVRRLAPFMRALRHTIQAAAPRDVENPSVVVLSPDPISGTAFEHAAMASRLGYPLVEGGDLRIRDGKVWLRTVSGLLPVHVILRHVPTGDCDALELAPNSTLGTPGLVEACRTGSVGIINPLGTGLAENFGLVSLLPALARTILNEDLLLVPADSWWCGHDQARAHVMANLGNVILRPLSRTSHQSPIDTRALSSDQLSALRERIEHEPLQWVGQEPFQPAAAPVLVGQELEPQATVLRGFMVANDDQYLVMPGGLARSSRAPSEPGPDGNDRSNGSLRHGYPDLVAKDTWVLGRDQSAEGDLGPVRVNDSVTAVERLPVRAVENLFWLGRYAERAEATVRLLRVVNQRRSDFQDAQDGPGLEALRSLLEATTRVTTTWPGFVGDTGAELRSDPGPELFALVTDHNRPGTVAHAIDRMMAAIDVVRDQLSIDTWLVVGSVQRQISDLDPDEVNHDDSVGTLLDDLLHRLLSLSGLATESMVRDQGWHVMDAGRRIERALRLIDLVADTLGRGHSPIAEGLLLESVATTHESVITYRRRYVWQARTVTLLELLFTDPGNPRSLRFQVDRLRDAVDALPHTGHHGNPPIVTSIVERLAGQVAALDPAALAQTDAEFNRPMLINTAAQLQQELTNVASGLASDYFARQVPQRSVSTPVERPFQGATS